MFIKIFTTGGSVDKIYSAIESNFVVNNPAIVGILETGNVNYQYDIEPLLKKDSLEITDRDRGLILNKVTNNPSRQIIITHGTDSIIDTAKILQAVKDKVIVLTGAMQPAAFINSDAQFNIGGAIIAVQTLAEGVYIVFNGQVWDPDMVVKDLDGNQFAPINR